MEMTVKINSVEWRGTALSTLFFLVFLSGWPGMAEVNAQICVIYETENQYSMGEDIPGIRFPDVQKRSTLCLYENYSKWQDDSIMVTSFNARENAKIRVLSNIVYKDYGTKSIYKKNPANSTCCVRKLDNSDYKWKIDKQKIKTILGLKCFYATAIVDGNYYYSAWYTEEIGISDGPMDFGFQLPGLILVLVDEKTNKTYKAISLFVNEGEFKRDVPDFQLDTKSDQELKSAFINREVDDRFIITKDYPIKKWVDIRFD